jgi:hypothetical protein
MSNSGSRRRGVQPARGEAPTHYPFTSGDAAAILYETLAICITTEYHACADLPVMIVPSGKAIDGLV